MQREQADLVVFVTVAGHLTTPGKEHEIRSTVPTDFVSVYFRENPANMRLPARCPQNYSTSRRQPIDVVRLLTGHYWKDTQSQ